MADSTRTATYLLRRLLSAAGDTEFAHAWIHEDDRWKELVFALLSRVTELPEGALREIVLRLGAMGLLDIAALAAMPNDEPHARYLNEALIEGGFTTQEAARGAAVLAAAARGFESHFRGKVQCYLRSYGERMLSELSQFFSFDDLDPDQVRHAFTYWLQNTTSMPVSLQDAAVGALCEREQITPADLFAAADAMDVNVALVDDLVRLCVEVKP